MLAFVTGGPVSRLWVRSLDSLRARQLTGTDNAILPSGAGRPLLGIFAGGKLKRIDLSGDKVLTIADAPTGRVARGTQRMSSCSLPRQTDRSGSRRIGWNPGCSYDAGRNARVQHRYPAFLPDGRRFLYYVRASEQPGFYLGSLDRLKEKPLSRELNLAASILPTCGAAWIR